jgi:endonuclease-8
VRFEAPRLVVAPFPPGTIVDGATAVGKHCLVHFDDGRTLRTHMRMTGSWHLYRPGEHWRKSSRQMRVVIEVPGWQAVCFSAPVVETYGPPPSAAIPWPAWARPVPGGRRPRRVRGPHGPLLRS